MCSPAARKIEAKKIIIIVTPFLFYIFLVVNGWLGVNFGQHWDEHIFVRFVDDFHINGRLIPTHYLYPSFCFYLILLASVIFRLLHPGLADVPSLLHNNDFSVFSRGVFVCVASLCVIWVYVLTLKITKRYWFACVAGLIFCCSFEFSYHSRWAVSDLIATQFAFLSTTILFLDMRPAKRVWWSALITGIAAGTKYTAGIVGLNLLIFMATSLQSWKDSGSMKLFVRQLITVCILFGLAFFITTPGCIYHLKTFSHSLLEQRNTYAGGHMLFDTVKPGWEHFFKITAYFALTLFSPLPVASIFISGLCLVGVAHALLKREWNIFGLFLVMAIYIAYVSLFKVMIVRNLLYALPYFAVLAAYGLFALRGCFKNKTGILVVDATLLCLVAFSLHAIVTASWSIYRKDSIDRRQDLMLFLDTNRKDAYVFSKGVRQLLASGNQPADRTNGPAMFLMFLNSEVKAEHFPEIAFNRYQTIAGPQDVNFNYYPGWIGADRIVIMKLKDANREMLNDLNLQ